MKKMFTPIFLLVAAGLFLGSSALAQKQSPLDIALRHLEQQKEDWNLADADISGLAVSDQYQSRHNQVTHLYFVQRHAGIELHNAVSGVHLTKEGRVGFATNGFTPRLAELVNTTTPALTPHDAIVAAAAHLNLRVDGRLRLLKQPGEHQYLFEGGNISDSDIKVQLKYQLMEDGKAYLAWDLALDMPNSADHWSLRIDALNGRELSRNNWALYCDFTPDKSHLHGPGCGLPEQENNDFRPLREALLLQNQTLTGDAVYHVFPAPVESPSHGERSIVTNPHDLTASPFGWHDTNGQEGPEYTITRGNNVHAYQDSDDTNSSAGDEPDGGDSLNFDFPFDPNLEPVDYRDAAATQLFYMNNYIHDFTYAYGFDEAAGNFQQSNYGNGGFANDAVRAESQDGSGTNNANFGTPPDGGSGRMQMFLWNYGGSIFSVDAPQAVAGSYEAQEASFGGLIPNEPLTAEAVVVDDGSNQASLGCEPAQNGDQLAGKIALIDRGVCEFGLKALNAQEAGAVGAIICNFEDDLVGMAGGASGAQVTIPVISMKFSDCQTIREFVGQGLTVTFKVPDDNGPTQLDASFDNGVIAHEYGHGISNRLTGGPSQAGCLSNDEQMGEGWSDFFALVTTVKEGDVGAQPRPIGTYLLRREPDGTGIRRQPYSNDMSVNDQTYEDIVGTTAPHPLGEIWAATLWDLYWALVDEYGWDPDQVHGTGGNNIAIQLVMDGMKYQECNPGFIAGRDAILIADELNNDGANQCLIWEVFTRRGLGYLAEGNNSQNRNDGLESYELLPECLKDLYITKNVTELIEPGEEITATLRVGNYKEEAATGVVVTDMIPDGASFVAGSADGAEAEIAGNQISFELGEMQAGEEKVITYRLASDPNLPSILQFEDDAENGEDNWLLFNLEGDDIWELTDIYANSGENAWYAPEVATESDQALVLIEAVEITGTQPVLRFFHRYETEHAYDGGFVEISTDGGGSWQSLNEEIFKNPYPRPLAYGTFAIPFLRAYSGSTNDEWVDTYIDLSAFAGEEALFRWRFGCDAEAIANAPNPGWYVDDIAIMDLFNYNSEACITDAQGSLACDEPDARGTLVATGEATTSTREEKAVAELEVFPNPARSLLNVAVSAERAQEATIGLLSAEGRILQEQQIDLVPGRQLIPVNISSLPAGFYFVRVNTDSGVAVEKIVIR